MNKKLLVIGAGGMAKSYNDVLQHFDVDYEFVCRSEASSQAFFEATGIRPISGGLTHYLAGHNPDYAIVATGVEQLANMTSLLLDSGVKNILIEKPGALYSSQLSNLQKKAKEQGAEVYIAYNRRFYASVEALVNHIADDGGLQSIHFDFTEWADRIAPLEKGEGVKENWVLSNSTHVIDLAFYLAGKPSSMSSFVDGGFDWHLTANRFVGSGITENNVLFSYRADWDSQGRWGITAYTKHHSYALCPLEGLTRISRNSVAIEQMDIDDTMDKKFKPGLYRQVEHFLTGHTGILSTLDDQINSFPHFLEIAGYKNC